MARFVFQLEGVLRHRKHLEQQRQRELALVQAQMATLQAELRSMDQSVQAATSDVRQNHLVGKLDLSFLAAHRRFTAAMQRKAMALMQRMALVQRQVDEAVKALMEAAKQRKVMEKLRERNQERWRADLNRRELIEQDDISMRLAYANVTDTQ